MSNNYASGGNSDPIDKTLNQLYNLQNDYMLYLEKYSKNIIFLVMSLMSTSLINYV